MTKIKIKTNELEKPVAIPPKPVFLTEESARVAALEKCLPAVVSIVISKDMPKVKRFTVAPFGPFSFVVPEFEKHKERVRIGGGSGFIVSKDGLVLTNRHVVADPEADYTIITQSGKKYEGKVLATDPISDIAILKIKDNNELPVLELGDSDKVKLGQTVLAIGYTLGVFQNTVSHGIVSGLARKIAAQQEAGAMEELRGIIQTDAAVNPGNSGGPLINSQGQVIGINVAMVFGAENVGFAIPINKAKKDLEDLRKYGRIRQPFLGVRYLLLNKHIAQEMRLPLTHGALIAREHPGEIPVVKGSPADKAGLREHDVILEYGGKKVSEDHPLSEMIEASEIGQVIELKVWRDGKVMKIKVKLEERKG